MILLNRNKMIDMSKSHARRFGSSKEALDDELSPVFDAHTVEPRPFFFDFFLLVFGCCDVDGPGAFGASLSSLTFALRVSNSTDPGWIGLER